MSSNTLCLCLPSFHSRGTMDSEYNYREGTLSILVVFITHIFITNTLVPDSSPNKIPSTLLLSMDLETRPVSHRMCLSFTQFFGTVRDPQSHGTTQRFNPVMEQYLHAFRTNFQDNWKKYLSLAGFAANNRMSVSTTVCPFFPKNSHNLLCRI